MKRVFLAAFALLAAATLAAQEQTQQQTITLTLDEAIGIALDENPTIKIADMEIGRQDYVRKETIGNLLPSLSASGQYTYYAIKQEMIPGSGMGTDNSINLLANLTVPLFVPTVYATMKMNDAQIAGAIESARSSRISMVNEVSKAYYALLMSEESLGVLRESEKLTQETVDNTRMLFEAELGSEYDYLSALSNQSSIMPNIIQAEGAIDIAEMYMKMLLGLPQDVHIKLTGSLGSYSAGIMDYSGNYSTDLSGNSELRSLEIQSRMLESQLKITNSQRMPTVSAFGQFTLAGSDMGAPSFGIPKEFRWQKPLGIGVSINVPIFTGNKINNQAKQAKVAINQLKLQRDYAEQATIMEVQTAISNLMTSRGKMDANEVAIKQAQKAYDISSVRYDGGAGTILELNTSQLQLTQAQLNYTQAVYDYLAAQADYEKIIGKNFE